MSAIINVLLGHTAICTSPYEHPYALQPLTDTESKFKLSRTFTKATAPWLRRSVANYRISQGSIPVLYVRFVVDKVALRPVYIREVPFSPASLIPPTLRAIFCSCSRPQQIATYL